MPPYEPGLRVVTLLTTDTASSTEQQLRLGDHRSDELRRERDGIVARAVEEGRGEVVKSTGDGTFAAFLSPSEALACAVAIQRSMARRNLVAGERVDLKIGLATGEVIVEDGDIFGLAAIMSTRITAHAQAGEVLCCSTTQALAAPRPSNNPVEYVGDVPLKGFDDPVPLYRVGWAEVFEPLVPLPGVLERSGAPFVGRPSVLATATQLWAATTTAHEPHLLVLGGEPGVGKTSVLARLSEIVHRSGATVLYGRCSEDDIDSLRPIRQALRQYIEARADALADELGNGRRELARLAPELRPLVGSPRGGDADHRAATAALLDAVAQWLAAASRVRPILFVIDDAEWLDAQTAKLLRRLAEEPELGPLLFALAHRDREATAGTGELTGLVGSLRSTATSIEVIRVGGLSAEEVDALVAQVHPAATGEAARLHRDSGGNPLYLLELLRAEAAGTPGTARAPGSGGAADLVLRRVQRLPQAHVDLLEAAAVLGQEFDLAAVERMLGRPPDETYKVLDALVRSDLLREGTPAGRFGFAHGLVRSAVYESLTTPGRVAHHRRAADTLEELAGTGRRVPAREIAHHHLRAAPSRGLDPALAWCRRAAADASDRLAYEEAGRWLQSGLDLFGQLELHPTSEVLDLQLERAVASQRAGEAGTRRRFLRAADTARMLGDAAGLRRVALAFDRGFFASLGRSDDQRVELLREALALSSDEPAERACLLALLASELTWEDGDERFGLADEALAVAREAGDQATLVRVLSLRPPTIWAPDTFDDVLAAVEELAALSRELRDPVLEGRYLHFRFGTASERGEMQRLPNVVARLSQLGWFLRLPDALWHATLLRANVALLNGHLAEARALAQESLEWGRRARAPEALMFWAAIELEARRLAGGLDEMATELLGARAGAADGGYSATRYLYDAGHAATAREDYASAMRGRWTPPKRLHGGPAAANLAYLASRFQDVPRAAHLFGVLAPYDGRFFQGIITYHVTEHYRGMLAATVGRLDEAAGLLRRAVERHDEVGAPLLGAESRLEWARLALLDEAAAVEDPLGLVDAALATAEVSEAPELAHRARQMRERL